MLGERQLRHLSIVLVLHFAPENCHVVIQQPTIRVRHGTLVGLLGGRWGCPGLGNSRSALTGAGQTSALLVVRGEFPVRPALRGGSARRKLQSADANFPCVQELESLAEVVARARCSTLLDVGHFHNFFRLKYCAILLAFNGRAGSLLGNHGVLRKFHGSLQLQQRGSGFRGSQSPLERNSSSGTGQLDILVCCGNDGGFAMVACDESWDIP
mmetsp:Transcript_43935/g.95681  ORF Transcript_43935/g.95681 Transcript_43935/m.95681 type:complete len:212 (+) Transcript_43935:1561-2196(+)